MSSWKINDLPAFCITLDRRPDRWNRFISQPGLNQLTNLKKYSGVDGKSIDIRNDNRIELSTKKNILAHTRRSHEELDSVGGVGCALSHIGLWEWLVNSEHDKVLIFEDDAVIPTGFVNTANKIISDSNILQSNQWDLLLLGGNWANVTAISRESFIRNIGGFYCLHAYVITKKTAQKLLAEVYPIHCHIDMWITIYKLVHGLRIVGTKAMNINQRNLKSEIQSNNGCKICDVSTDFYKSHVLVNKYALYTAYASAGILAYLYISKLIKN
jgi:GR25 family glycosyltransferase involved in LPS biosynthesis